MDQISSLSGSAENYLKQPSFIIIIAEIYSKIKRMKEHLQNQYNGYYNQFLHIRESTFYRNRHKLKSNTCENIKIAHKKLPPDFFQTITREPPHLIHRRQTPCFGEERKQSSPSSALTRNRHHTELTMLRVATLPVHDFTESPQPSRHSKRQQYSQRQFQQIDNTQQDKYFKKTANEKGVALEGGKKTLNLKYENHITHELSKQRIVRRKQFSLSRGKKLNTNRKMIEGRNNKLPALIIM